MEVGMDELRQILDKIERPSKEDNLKQVVLEIAEVEYSFCVKLKSMSLDYPKFIKQNSPKNKNLLTEYPIITKITQNLNQILNVHSFLLDKFVEAIENWKDNDPNIASIFTKQAGFLKMCTTFLGEKANYTNQLNAALEENEKLAELTRKYETELLSNCNHNAHKSSESMPSSGLTFAFELDSVHQNIVRYNLLMRRYQNALSEEKYPSEYEASVKAINNLQSVSQNVDHYLFQKAQKKRMLELCRRFPDGENLLIIPSRNLIHDGELIKQGRKDKLARYLILFDDVLLVCGISLLSNSLDNSKTKTYRLDEYQVECVEKIDYEREFKLLTNDKSNSFICDTKAIRDLWVKKLNEAQEQYIENKKNKEQLLPRQDGNGQTSNVETRNTTAAVWVSDKKSTTCMMIDCGSKFGRIIVRRHHCRKCGYLICSKCTGEAPVPSGGSEEKGNSVIQKVCPECFIEVKAKYSSVYEASKFRAPKNFNLKRMRYETGERSIIYEKVHRQDEVRRWAQMMDNCFAIYEAEMVCSTC
uniref:FYVE-type domain-containing protein n=1 Tax=Rhabditophanes sp. KR3021 TaxID=114890 RepID=A0AC35TZ38_9BILA